MTFTGFLPRGLRQHTAGMSWDAVLAAYGPLSGPLQLGAWACVGTGRPGARPGLQNRKFQATLAIGDRVCKSSVAAAGPVAALTEMLHEHGFAVELLSFHQLEAGADTVTAVHGSDGTHDEWALGWDPDPGQSALRALIACANRLAG